MNVYACMYVCTYKGAGWASSPVLACQLGRVPQSEAGSKNSTAIMVCSSAASSRSEVTETHLPAWLVQLGLTPVPGQLVRCQSQAADRDLKRRRPSDVLSW